MPPIIERPPAVDAPPRPLWSRIGWFAVLWLAGLGGTAAAAYLLRALILQR